MSKRPETNEPATEPELWRGLYDQLSAIADSIVEHGPRLSPPGAELGDAVLDTVQDLCRAVASHYAHHHAGEEPLEGEESEAREARAKSWMGAMNEATMLAADLTIATGQFPHDADLAAERDAAHSLIDDLLDFPI